MGFTTNSIPDQSGRSMIVTGANTGIGFEIARMLAEKGAKVFLGCRSEEKGREAIRRIQALHKNAQLELLPLDLSDLDSIRTAAEQMNAGGPLDVLINNAGVMYPPLMRTKQGFELQFGVNHLGCFALTALLLPKLAETGGGRVVITSSLAHKGGSIPFDDLNSNKVYQRTQRYSDTKLANLLFCFELDRRLKISNIPVAAIGCHPGVAATELGRYSGVFRPLLKIAGAFLNTPEMGAWPALQAATDPEAQSGAYYGPTGFAHMRGPSGLAEPGAASKDREVARRLWDVSVSMTGIDPHLPAGE